MVGVVTGPEHLAAGLCDPPIGKRHLLDTPTGTVTGLEHHHVRAGSGEVARRRQATQPGSHHSDVNQIRYLPGAPDP
jgi:hypothetical protein